LRMEASVAAAAASGAPSDAAPTDSPDKGKAVYRGEDAEASPSLSSQSTNVASLPIPISQASRGSSHLRQMSNASSVSSGMDSAPGSYSRNVGGEDPSASGLSLGGGKSEDEGAGTESMFNFRSLAQMVGVPIDGEEFPVDSERENPSPEPHSDDNAKGSGSAGHHEHVEHAAPVITTDAAVATDRHDEGESSSTSLTGTDAADGEKPLKLDTNDLRPSPGVSKGQDNFNSGSHMQPPSVMITPETPAPLSEGEEDSKQLGHTATVERSEGVTQ
jgi:hypothetical protein